MKLKEINSEQFNLFFKNLNLPTRYKADFCYDLISDMFDSINETSTNLLDTFNDLNVYQLILYLIFEFVYFTEGLCDEQYKERCNDDKFLSITISSALDKYLTNEKVDVKNPIYVSKFFPNISTLRTYLKFMHKILKDFNTNNSADKLINDYLTKAVSISRCCLDLLEDGFETEAFSTWRTLHETECILQIFIKNQKDVVPAYMKHMTYSAAFRKIIKDQNEVDKIFEQIKSEMKSLDLKSKDMKKFIEYGYLTAIPGLEIEKDFKLNFRDGVEKIAGLSSYSKFYEYSSEIAHSSPLMIYSNQKLLFHLTLVLLYEVFFRLEQLFDIFFKNTKDSNLVKLYSNMHNLYNQQMLFIYNKEKAIYHALSKNN